MTLADDMPPTDCIAVVAEKLGGHSSIILANLPEWGDSPQIRLEKWSVIEQALLVIKEHAKEGLKARLMGSQSAVNDREVGSSQQKLPSIQETDIKAIVTGPDGIERDTSIETLEAEETLSKKVARIGKLKSQAINAGGTIAEGK